MKRHNINVRDDWQKKVESQGLLFHTASQAKYWDESAYYEFSSEQIDELESATNELHQMSLEAVDEVISNERYAELKIPESAIPLIEYSWNNETAAIYGRMDLSYDGKSPPKLLEYNADTPTSLLEAAVIQWYWLEERFPGTDQFNSIHERLVDKWKELKHYLFSLTVHFSYMDELEDYMNVSYLRDTANQAGVLTKEIDINDIGWATDNRFVDLENETMSNIFKLYPWEWLLKDSFSKHIESSIKKTLWIEPPWKMILSNKGILPILWELNEGHPNLLAAYYEPSKLPWHAKKPFYSREGANVSIKTELEEIVSTEGVYGEEGYVYQDLALLPKFDENYPVIGSWVIDGQSAGIGIRESKSLITDNLSRFVPHLFK